MNSNIITDDNTEVTNYEKIKFETKFGYNYCNQYSSNTIFNGSESKCNIPAHNALATKEKSTVNDNAKDCSQQSNEQIDNNNKNNKDCNQNANNQEQEDKDNGKDKSNDS